jgi:hypothetical protein
MSLRSEEQLPLGTPGITSFAASYARIAEKAWSANTKLKARTLTTPSLTWMERLNYQHGNLLVPVRR